MVPPKVATLVPPLVAKVTVEPPAPTWFPFASYSVSVTGRVAPSFTVSRGTVITESAATAGPGTTCIGAQWAVATVPETSGQSRIWVPAFTPVNSAA